MTDIARYDFSPGRDRSLRAKSSWTKTIAVRKLLAVVAIHSTKSRDLEYGMLEMQTSKAGVSSGLSNASCRCYQGILETDSLRLGLDTART